jgi:iron complex transport system substrate-binding protein
VSIVIRLSTLRCFGLTIVSLLLPVVSAAAPLAVIDDTHERVLLSGVPERIVSLAPGTTEMLFSAGAGAHVIATVDFTDDPPAARAIPRIGDSNAIDLERLELLHPDVVVVWPGGNNPAQIAQIAALGFPLYRQQIDALADIGPSLRRLGALAGTTAAADSAAARLELELEALRREFASRARVRVLLQVWDHPIYTIGGTQLLSDALRVCGAENIFDDVRVPGPAVTLEAVVSRDPVAIVAAAPAVSAREWLKDWSRFPHLRAVRAGNTVVFDDPRLTRLGPSILPATRALCGVIEQARERAQSLKLLN